MNLSTGNDYADSLFSDIAGTFITQTLQRNNLISTGPAPAGNQTAAQIANGQAGSLPTPVSAGNTGVMNSLGLGNGSSKMVYYVIGAVLVVGLILAVRK